MDSILDLAVAFENRSLTLLVGTGFSKFITDGKAPSWLELLEMCTATIDSKRTLRNTLFNYDGSDTANNTAGYGETSDVATRRVQ